MVWRWPGGSSIYPLWCLPLAPSAFLNLRPLTCERSNTTPLAFVVVVKHTRWCCEKWALSAGLWTQLLLSKDLLRWMTVNLAAFLNLKRVKGQQPEGSSSPGVAVVFCRHEGSSGAPASHPQQFQLSWLGQRPLFTKRKAFFQEEGEVL